MADSSKDFIEWLTSASPSTFILGVLVLIFGTRKVLSAKNVEESLGGLALPFKWLREHRDRAAAEEASAEIELREMYADQHKYILHLTKWILELQIWAAARGEELPPPEFMPFNEWRDAYGARASRRKKEDD